MTFLPLRHPERWLSIFILPCAACTLLSDPNPDASVRIGDASWKTVDASPAVDGNSGQDAGRPDVVPDACAAYAEGGAAFDGWVGPTAIGTAIAQQNGGLSLVVAPTGDAFAAWLNYDEPGGERSVWASRFDGPSQTWGSAVLLETEDNAAWTLSAAVDRAGNVFVVWKQEGEAGNQSTWANRFDAKAQAWQGAAPIDNAYTPPGPPSIVVDQDGNAFAVWRQEGGPDNEAGMNTIWANRFDAAQEVWSGPAVVQARTESVSAASVAVDGNGNVLLVWGQLDEGTGAFVTNAPGSIWECRFDAQSQRWRDATLIDDEAVGFFGHSVAFDAQGNAILVGQQRDDEGSRSIAARHFDAQSQTWLDPVLIDSQVADALEPAIAIDPSGNALVVWRQQQGESPSTVWANRFDGRSQAWLGAEPIASAPTFAINRALDMDCAGNAFVVWDNAYTLIAMDVRANRFDAQSRNWRGPAVLASFAAGPRVAMDGAGGAIVVWLQPDGNGSATILASRLQ